MALRVAWGDAAAHLFVEGTPLGIVRLVNVVKSRADWSYQFRIDGNGRTVLDAVCSTHEPWDLTIDDVLSGVVPEALNADAVELHRGTVIERYDGLRSLLNTDNTSSQLPNPHFRQTNTPINRIRFEGYFGSVVPSVLYEIQQVAAYIRDRTWFGSSKYASPTYRLRWRVMAYEWSVSSDNLTQYTPSADPSFLGTMDAGRFRMYVRTNTALRKQVFRHSDYGQIDDVDFLEPVTKALRELEALGFLCELDTAVLRGGVLGAIAPTDFVTRDVQLLANAVRAWAPLREYAQQVRAHRKERAARLLNARIQGALAARTVTYGGEDIAREPSSELGTVALFHILEGMRAVPFPHFQSRAWAGAEGIDLIADVQFASDQPVRMAAPIEFEYRLPNFVAHQHPHDHVELIICWSLGDGVAGLESTPHPWLFYYRVASRSVPVAVVSEFPDVRVI